jgi:hypothetical protein
MGHGMMRIPTSNMTWRFKAPHQKKSKEGNFSTKYGFKWLKTPPRMPWGCPAVAHPDRSAMREIIHDSRLDLSTG